MKEVLQQANDFVRAKELGYARGLVREKNRLEQSNCQCPSCQKAVIGLEIAFKNEAVRLYPEGGPVDHEEEWIERNK